MSEFKESSPVDAVVALDVSTNGRDVALILHFESNIAVRFPMTAPVAMRIWAALDQARQDNGWLPPTTPVSTDRIQ